MIRQNQCNVISLIIVISTNIALVYIDLQNYYLLLLIIFKIILRNNYCRYKIFNDAVNIIVHLKKLLHLSLLVNYLPDQLS